MLSNHQWCNYAKRKSAFFTCNNQVLLIMVHSAYLFCQGKPGTIDRWVIRCCFMKPRENVMKTPPLLQVWLTGDPKGQEIAGEFQISNHRVFPVQSAPKSMENLLSGYHLGEDRQFL